jgi:4'-phosphopantetheinyl transferase
MQLEDADDQLVTDATRWLDCGERQRLARFAREPDARAFLVGRWLARRALARHSGTSPDAWAFTLGDHGKPEGAGPLPAPAFNLSHGGGVVICAASTFPGCALGVDVEAVDRRLPGRRLDRFLTPRELQDIGDPAAPGHAHRFWRVWTLKEAALKAAGTGVAGTLAAAEIDLQAAGGPRVRSGLPLARLTLLELSVASPYCVSLAVDAPATSTVRLASLERERSPDRS